MNFCIRDYLWWQEGDAMQEVSSLPTLLRRRIGKTSQQTLHAAMQMPDAAQSRIILCSRHADFNRTLGILDAVVKNEQVSPADFSLSAHHVLAGLLSIAQKNLGGHTAIAGGIESFCYGLVEATACLHDNPQQPILLIYYNVPLTAPFDEFNENFEKENLFVLALHANEGQRISIEMEANTNIPCLVPPEKLFFDFITGNDLESIAIGDTKIWHWMRHVAI